MREIGSLTRVRASTPSTNMLLTRVPRMVFSGFMLMAIVVWVLPLIGLITSSFRPFTDAASSGWWTTVGDPNFTLGNFREALGASGFLRALVNSLLITVPTVILVVITSSLAAFALIWTGLPGRKWLYAAMVGLLVVPPEITLVPTLNILKTLHLINTFPGIWLSHISAIMPFAIFLLGNFFAQIPAELVEAARVDGAKARHVLFRVVIPLSGAALASLATFDFLWVWNDLLRALVIIPDPNMQPLTAVLANLSGGYGQYVTVMAAGAVLLMIPPLLVFLLAQKAFIRGVLTGAVKT